MITSVNQLNNLPADVKAYLTSLKATELNLFLLKKNKIAPVDFGKVTDIITRLFVKAAKVSDLPAILKTELNLDELAAKTIAIDITGIRLLIVKDWLKEDLESLIKTWGGNSAEFAHYIEDQKKALAEEEKYFAEQLAPEPKFVFKPKTLAALEPVPALDIAKEKIDSLDLFKNNLVDLLRSQGAEEFISDYNLILISLISDDVPFRQSLENALYTNSEEVTSERLKSEEKEVAPTIANWLKDFIRENSSEMFDEIVLARYLSSTVNAKKLSQEDKHILRRLFKLYRNLAFFPASMGNASLEEWEIIPVEREEEKVREVALGAPASRTKENLVAVKDTLIAVPPVDSAMAELAEMEEILEKYNSSSLEHKAIKQEITRFKKKAVKK